ncbi:MAG: transcriptional regulator [Erysipelotrichaceae bacterium]|nr:transcriptional regulator [Erysipelotrichaceae bacterium]
MINIIDETKVMDSTIRIQILLYLNRSSMSYTELKNECGIADGAMTNHITKLKDAEYISAAKGYEHNRPKTTYSITDTGRAKIKQFVADLNESLNS